MPNNNDDKELPIHSAAHILGFNINGTRTAVVYGDLNGLVYERLQLETPRDEPFISSLDILCQVAEKLLVIVQAQRLPSPDLVSVAISGDLDQDLGVLEFSPDLPEWKAAPIKGRMSIRFNLPIFLEQEANAGALAEYYFGAGQDYQNLVFLSMEPTLRAGILSNGQVYRSPGGYSGNLGKIKLAKHGPAGYGQPGSLNGFASASGMVELAHLRFPGYWDSDLGIYQLIEAAHNGDLNASQVFAEAGDWLGQGLCPLVHLLHPQVMIVGNPGCLLEEVMLVPARLALEKCANLPMEALPELVPAGLGAKLTDISALVAAIDHYRKQSL